MQITVKRTQEVLPVPGNGHLNIIGMGYKYLEATML
jgi:hypothetical protein